MNGLSRRRCLACALALAVAPSARADPPALAAAIWRFTGGVAARPGRVTLELPELVENGNGVPVTVIAQSPMTEADHVTALALFTERNPQPEVAVFRLGPRAGRARVSTRMRLATSQRVVALARMSDGSLWTQSVDVIVTLAACVES